MLSCTQQPGLRMHSPDKAVSCQAGCGELLAHGLPCILAGVLLGTSSPLAKMADLAGPYITSFRANPVPPFYTWALAACSLFKSCTSPKVPSQGHGCHEELLSQSNLCSFLTFRCTEFAYLSLSLKSIGTAGSMGKTSGSRHRPLDSNSPLAVQIL